MTTLPTPAYTINTSKQKKTIEEKQAKKKERKLWRPAGAQWREKGRDLEVVLIQIFKLSSLSSQSYRLQL